MWDRCDKVSYEELYRWGRQLLEEAQVPDAGNDARLLLEWCCGTDRNTLLAHGDRVVSGKKRRSTGGLQSAGKSVCPCSILRAVRNLWV